MLEQAWMSNFLLACLVMGLGIGLDVAIATFMRAHSMQKRRVAAIWVVGVSTTHTVFPMIGYLLTYFSLQTLPVLTPFIGVLAFSLIAHFLYSELKISEEEGEQNQSLVSIGLILAVSWDALWSGPAKSAQVLGWSEWMVWTSFLLVGLVVTVFCVGSLYAAKKLSHLKLFNIAHRFDWAVWIQYSVIAYFGLLALLRYTLGIPLSWQYILLIALVFMFLVMKWQGNEFESSRQSTQEA